MGDGVEGTESGGEMGEAKSRKDLLRRTEEKKEGRREEKRKWGIVGV